MTRRAVAFCPAGVSSFFEICDRTPEGKPITDAERVGARGGGFALTKGVRTEVAVDEADESTVQVFINGEACPEAETTRLVAQMLTERVSGNYAVKVFHSVEVPVGAGFGSSAAGALGAAFALSRALGLNLTCNQLGRIAHVAEVKSKTGLGTVGPLMFGGCGLTLEPGAPGIALLDRIPVSPDYRIVAGCFNSYPTKDMLASEERRDAINEWGRRTLRKILSEPSLGNFMAACKEFAVGAGFVTERVKRLMDAAEAAGAVGAAQNMVGEAVHALVTVDKLDTVLEAFRKFLPEQKLIIASVDIQGARIGE